jgi:glycosyltransferase involved in cell wall biosynthesis
VVETKKIASSGKPGDDHMPAVGLGMPLYNQTRYLPEAMRSLLSQSYGNFKLIVSDDSTDPGPGRIIKSFADRDQRIIYHNNEGRKGLIENWRNCFHLAGEVDFFAWVGDHDAWHPKWLESMVQALSSHESVVLAYPQTVNIDEQGRFLDKKVKPGLSTLGLNDAKRIKAVCQQGRGFGNMVYGLFRTRALRRAGVFPRVMWPDVILCHKLALQGDIHQVDEQLWYRRRTDRFSIPRQKGSLFVKKPWYFHLPWPLVNAWVLARNLPTSSATDSRSQRKLRFQMAAMYLWRWWSKYGGGSWFGSPHEWRKGKKPWMKKIKRQLKGNHHNRRKLSDTNGESIP